jgi:hypothetical protein
LLAFPDDLIRRGNRNDRHLERREQQLVVERRKFQREELHSRLELEWQLQPGHDRLSGGLPGEQQRIVLELDRNQRQPGEFERQQQRRQLHRRRRRLRSGQLLQRLQLRPEQQHLRPGDTDSGRRRRGPELRIGR